MTHLELAEQLDGNEYRNEMTPEHEQLAKDNSLVVMYFASDNLIMLSGAIDEELGFDTVLFWNKKLFLPKEPFDTDEIHEQIKFLQDFGLNVDPQKVDHTEITSGNPHEGAYAFDTEIDHSQFLVMEDGETCCIGIVFSLLDLN